MGRKLDITKVSVGDLLFAGKRWGNAYGIVIENSNGRTNMMWFMREGIQTDIYLHTIYGPHHLLSLEKVS